MPSLIVLLCRTIIISEGIIGIVLHGTVFVRLWNRKMISGWSTHRIGMSFSAVHGFIISFIGITSCLTHLFHYENFLLIIYGPIAYLPKIFSDISVFCNCVFVIGMWDFLPASCLLQYLALCKPHLSDLKRIGLSYVLSFSILFFSMPQYTSFYAPPSLLATFDEIAKDVHGLTEDDVFYIYGVTLFATPPYKDSMISVAAFAILPPYIIAYVVFIVSCSRISRALGKFGVTLSAKTIEMQRRFLKMMLMQGLLPLIVLSVPVGTFLIAMISGMAMDKKTLLITFSIWAVPIVQGSVALFYVNGIGNSSDNSQNTSTNTRSSVSVVKLSGHH